MARELAFALINPYSIAKSRTGGIISRFMSRTGLDLVGARMYGPSQELADAYADMLRKDSDQDPKVREILSDYIRQAYAPAPQTGRKRRVLMLLFEGEDAVEKIARVAGPFHSHMETGETVRDTFGDFVLDAQGNPRYVEPAVMTGTTVRDSAAALRLWASFSEKDGGIVENATDIAAGEIQRTLVLIKPDNFRFPSSRPGNIIDLFSRSGLRIIGAKVHRMSVAEAENFYGPVQAVLREKLRGVVGERSARVLSQELGIEIPAELQANLGNELGPYYAERQFHEIIRFMTGLWPNEVDPEARMNPGNERCLALVYTGVDAVKKIRSILGPTDPSRAEPGSVRREYGRDILVNAAHASDSPENAAREMKIIKVEQDTLRPWIEKYCA